MSAKENLKIALREIFLSKPSEPINKHTSLSSSPTATFDFFDADTSVLSACSRIDGNLYSDGHVRINGIISGNVVAKGNIYAKGRVKGDISCRSIVVSSCEILGSISAVEDAKIEKGSVVRGDVEAKNLFSSGELYGDLYVGEHVHFSSTALTSGSIRAKTITMDEGASINGQIVISHCARST